MKKKNLYIFNDKEYKNRFSNTILKSSNFYLKKNFNKINNDFDINLSQQKYKLIKFFIKNIFSYVVNRLEKYHGKKFNKKFWKIILYSWLDYIVPTLYIRWQHISKINRGYLANIYSYNKNCFISDTFENLNNSNLHFNKWILSEIIEYQKKLKYKKIKVHLTIKTKKKNLSFFNKVLFFFFNFIFKNTNYKFLIKNIGLGKFKSILFYLKLKKIPIPLIETDYIKSDIDFEKRKKYFYNSEKKKNFINFFKKNLIYLIPKNFLENFENLMYAVEKSYWPKSVKAVMVGNDYYFNDFFKFWMANQSLYGAKLFIMQHGGLVGTSKFITNEYIQRSIGDFFLTWGWDDKKDKKIYPFFCTYFTNKIKRKYTSNIIYFLQNIPANYYGHVDGNPISIFNKIERLEYPNRFYQKLNSNMKKKFILRYLEIEAKKSLLHPCLINKKIIVDKGFKKLSMIIKNAKIFVHDNHSTAFLETLAYNVPTFLIFKKNDYNKIRKNALVYYKILEDCGIIQKNIENLYNFIKLYSSDIESWWFSKKVQNARTVFTQKFIKIPKCAVDKIINFFYLNEKKNYAK